MPHKPYGLAVKALVIDEMACCLLLRRSRANRNFVGKWECPGGKVEPCESIDAAAVREIREETGLEFHVTRVAGVSEFEVAATRVALLWLEGKHTPGEVRLSEEHDQFAWVPLSELKKWDLVEHGRQFLLDFTVTHARGWSQGSLR